jgi:hypothetical protein
MMKSVIRLLTAFSHREETQFAVTHAICDTIDVAMNINVTSAQGDQLDTG